MEGFGGGGIGTHTDDERSNFVPAKTHETRKTEALETIANALERIAESLAEKSA